MANSKHPGICALCGKECELTFEHVPSKAAFNSSPSKFVTGDNVVNTLAEKRLPWDLEGLKYQNMQKGTGFYTLCQECNSFTGTHYGTEYKHVAIGLARLMCEANVQPRNTLECTARFKPLLFVKQVLSFFCSINHDIAEMDDIKKFVLNKESTVFPEDRFHIGMYLALGALQRFAPYSVLVIQEGEVAKQVAVSEIAAFPLGFVLFFGNPANLMSQYLDITSFTGMSYDEECQMEMTIPTYECNIMIPLNYRSKEELEKARKNEMSASAEDGR